MRLIDKDAIAHLADLLRERNRVDERIAGLIGRPAHTGHVGEWIAARIFGVKLNDSAIRPGSDGRFSEPPFAGRTVNVKLYTTRTNVLDMKELDQPHPDFYLVMTGPKVPAGSSRDCTHPIVIREVFLFEAGPLVERLKGRVKGIGTSTSVTEKEWEDARIYPVSGEAVEMQLCPDQVAALALLRGD